MSRYSALSLRPLETIAFGVPAPTLMCFSHLRWNFDFERPQHLMSRFARQGRVIYWEGPEDATPECDPALGIRTCAETGVIVVTPSLPPGMTEAERERVLKGLLDAYLAGERGPFVRWYNTPAMLSFTRDMPAIATIYDRAEAEPAAWPLCARLEQELLDIADLVFAAAESLYRAIKPRHPNVHLLPSSLDRAATDPSARPGRWERRLALFGWDAIWSRTNRLMIRAVSGLGIGSSLAAPGLALVPGEAARPALVAQEPAGGAPGAGISTSATTRQP